eukprot:s178_g59.t1
MSGSPRDALDHVRRGQRCSMCQMLLLQVACILEKTWDLKRQNASWRQNALSTYHFEQSFGKGAEGSVNQDSGKKIGL